MATLIITYRCNNDCFFCVSFKRDLSLSLRQIAQWADRHIRSGEKVLLSGGEPTIHPDFLEIVAHLHDRGAKPVLQTNARTFDSTAFCDAAVQNGLSGVVASIYGLRATTHNDLTRSTSFDQTIGGIRNLLNSRIRVEVRHLLHARTLPELDLLPRFAAEELPGLRVLTLVACEYEEGAFRHLGRLWHSLKDFNRQVLGAVQVPKQCNLQLRLINMAPCLVAPQIRNLAMRDWLRGIYLNSPFLSPLSTATCLSLDIDRFRYVPACNQCGMLDRCDGILRRYFDIFPEVRSVSPV